MSYDTKPHEGLTRTIDALLAEAVEAGDVPGVTLSVVDREGFLYKGAAGVLKAGSNTPARTDSLIWLASQSKLLVVLATLQAIEERLASIDDNAGKFLPEIDQIPVFDGFESDGTVRTRPAKTKVTLRHLITHTAGGGYPFFNPTVRDIQSNGAVPSILSGRLESLRRTPWLFEPGSAFEYGTNIDWLGRVLEAITGTELSALVKTKITDPLGLLDISPLLDAERRAKLLSVHGRAPNGALQPIDFALPENPEFQPGGHYLFGTVSSYARLLQALLRGGELDGVRILKKETIEAGFRNQIGELLFHPITSADRNTTNDVDLIPGVTHRWAYFGAVNEAPAPWSHPAGSIFWAGLANSYYWIDPTRGIAGAIGTQILPFANPKVLALQNKVEQIVGAWVEETSNLVAAQ